MAKLRFYHYIEWEFDTDTNKSRVVTKYGGPKGKGSTQRKSKPKKRELSTELSEEYL